MELRHDACYRALSLRDRRFDGRFYTGVVTTGVFCRPICPARTPSARNCLFFASAAAAQSAGFRPCLRCRPEVAPTVASWRGTAATVTRALSLIGDGALDEASLPELSDRLGVGARQLRRLFLQHLGAPPVAVAQARRALFAKALLQETALPVGEVALAAGFGSLRRFNTVMRRALGRAPNELRRGQPAPAATGVTLRLPYAEPFDWPGLASWLSARTIQGVESGDLGCYRRTVQLEAAVGTIEVRPAKGALVATVRLSNLAALAQVAARLRRLFDLEADAAAIGSHLSQDALLKPLVSARPGLRVPGAWDGFELAVRAILGQQISVAAAVTLATRIAERFGKPLPAALQAPDLDRLFPTAEQLAAADLSGIGLTKARAKSLLALAQAAAADPGLLSPAQSLEHAVEKLSRLPGVGPWTAHYIALRGLREPDAFPASDLGLVRAAGLTAAQLEARAEAWRPYRAYAALHLWTRGSP